MKFSLNSVVFAITATLGLCSTAMADTVPAKPAAIIYINGLGNDFDASVYSKDLLKAAFPDHPEYTFDLAFNKQDGGAFLYKLFGLGAQTQFVAQKNAVDSDTKKGFWGLLDRPEVKSGGAIDDTTYKSFITWLTGSATGADHVMPEITDHIALYNKYLAEGRKVVIVPHSQGNFYANAALNLILAHQPAARGNISAVGFGDPSSHLLPGSVYFTSVNDSVMLSVRDGSTDSLTQFFGLKLVRDQLPTNITNPITDVDPSGHQITGYLATTSPSRQLIIDSVNARAKSL